MTPRKLRTTFTTAALSATLAVGAIGCSASADATDDSGASTTSALTGSCDPSHAVGAVSAPHRALLDTIAFTEGTSGHGHDGYDVTFAYHQFDSCTRHPDRRVCAGRYCSTAAGRYQFLTTTWNALGYDDFGPANQDRAGIKLVARRGATVPEGRPLTATEFANTMNRISYEWASLPPGRYGQPSFSMAATRREYCKLAGC